jgi:hypothetical protein
MSYIGNSPGVASQRVTTTLVATAGQTQFTAQSGYVLGYVDVYLNGAKLVNGSDFEAITGTYVTLFAGATVGDVVELISYVPRGLTDGYTKAEADAKFLDVGGDTATGSLALAAVGITGNLTLSGGTVNGVPYLNASKVLTTGSALTFNGTDFATTGIITAGSSVLSTASNNTARMIAAVGGVYFGSTTAADVIFQYNQNEGMRLTSTNLGIGTSSPTAKLHISGGAFRVDSTNGADAVMSRTTNDGNGMALIFDRSRSGGALVNNDDIGTIYFRGYDGAATQFTAGISARVSGSVSAGSIPTSLIFMTSSASFPSERMRIDSSGNVGINTTAPLSGGSGARWLTIAGNSGSTYSGGIALAIGSTNQCWIYQDTDNLVSFQGAGSNAGFKWGFGASNKMSLDSSGNLSNSGGYSNSLIANFNISTNTNYSPISIVGDKNIQGNGQYIPLLLNCHDGSTLRLSNGLMQFSTGNGERMRIDGNGNLLIGATSSAASNRAFFYGNSGTTIRVSDGTNTNWRGYVMGATSADAAEYAFLKLNANSGELQHYVGPNSYGGFQTFYTSGSERMRIDTNGIVSTASGMVVTSGQATTGTVTTDASGNATIGISGWSWGDFNSYRRSIFVMFGLQNTSIAYLGTWVGVLVHASTNNVISTVSVVGSTGTGSITVGANGTYGTRWFQLSGGPANTTLTYTIRGHALTEEYRSNYGSF